MHLDSAKKRLYIYVIQVLTQNEEKFLTLTMNALKASGLYELEKDKFFWPRRTLERKKKGIRKTRTDALFPGYIFYRSREVDIYVYRLLKKVPGFMHFLKDNHKIEPLTREDEELVMHFVSFGGIAEKSKVYFDENNMITIIDGPLKGLEGKIVKVDKRKKRAKVILNLYKKSFPIDLGFDVMVPTEKSDKSDET